MQHSLEKMWGGGKAQTRYLRCLLRGTCLIIPRELKVDTSTLCRMGRPDFRRDTVRCTDHRQPSLEIDSERDFLEEDTAHTGQRHKLLCQEKGMRGCQSFWALTWLTTAAARPSTRLPVGRCLTLDPACLRDACMEMASGGSAGAEFAKRLYCNVVWLHGM